MGDSYFFDTNIIAYSFDKSDETKWKKCRELVRGGFQGESSSFISNQVLAELFVVLTAKVGKPVPRAKAAIVVRSFIESQAWKKVNYDHRTVQKAMSDAGTAGAPFWDLLIAETMRDAGVRKIYTENVGDFKKIPWVEPVNPLHQPRRIAPTPPR